MYCTVPVSADCVWVGGNDRRLSVFEGVYAVPNGISYNSYLITDESTVLLDTADKAVAGIFFENVAHALNGREFNYVIVQHMEPDHSASLAGLLERYPEATVVCSAKAAELIGQFFGLDISARCRIVREGDTLCCGRHTLRFVMAPMVHWPEVMLTYDETDKTLFSADAFGTFGALNGALFADEVDFMHDYMDEARRYYCNIVGKYGPQVQALLKKASTLDIHTICPLHGFVWRRDLGTYIEKYQLWSSYTPEEQGVMIAYGSVYGNTQNAAELLACRLRALGVRTVMYDVSMTPAADIVAAAFRWSHLAFASATCNNGIFVRMEELLHDLAAHNLQKRTVGLIENGSWAPAAGKLMRGILASCKDMTILEGDVTLRSSVKEETRAALDALAERLAASIQQDAAQA